MGPIEWRFHRARRNFFSHILKFLCNLVDFHRCVSFQNTCRIHVRLLHVLILKQWLNELLILFGLSHYVAVVFANYLVLDMIVIIDTSW